MYFCPFKNFCILLKRNVIACLAGLFLWSLTMEGQVFRINSEAGVFAGVSYYLGNINPRGQFYSPGVAAGALFKHNFTEHHVLRINVFYGQLKGNDLDFSNTYQQMRVISFKTSLMDCHVGYEFNFLPYIINRKKKSQTPYIFVGLGYSLIQTTTTSTANDHLTIPFGVGYKYRYNEKIAFGCEWGLRKAFNDRLDGILSPGYDGKHTPNHNTDWYSFAGVYLTLKVFEKEFVCPGMKEQKVFK